jgi:hypothetical protein
VVKALVSTHNPSGTYWADFVILTPMDKELKTYLEGMEKRIDTRFDRVDNRFDEVNNRFDSVRDQFVSIREEMATKEELGEVMSISSKILVKLEDKQGALEKRVDRLETKIA